MREFKFRMWDAQKNEMISPRDGDLISWHGPSNWRDFYTVLQYTGMKDCEGVEIYEGDILDDGSGYLYVVSFIDGRFAAHEKNDVLMLTNLDDYDFEVIGNIYETPELLE